MLINRFINNFLLKDCALQEDKVENFIMKFDENVEKETEKIIIIKTEKVIEKDDNNGLNINININK